MEIEYKLTKENYLEHLLYDYSQDYKNKNRFIFIGQIFIAIALIIVIYFKPESVYYFIALLLVDLYYIIRDLFYSKSIIRSNTLKNIKSKFSEDINCELKCIVEAETISFIRLYEENKIKTKNITNVTFLKNTIIFTIVNNSTYLLTLNEKDTQKFIEYLKIRKIPIKMDLEWKW